jgi:TRAP-type C4-dicarboxylate transport system substrate-binding protein
MSKGKKLIVNIGFIIAFILTLALGGVVCAKEVGEKLVFKWANSYTEGHLRTKVWKDYSARVLKVTDGQIEFKMFSGQSLVKAREEYEAVVTGAIDISIGNSADITGYQSWVHFVAIPGVYRSFDYLMEILKMGRPIIEREFDKSGLKLLWLHPCTICNLYSRKGFVKTMDDFKGLKGRIPGGFTSESFIIWGGATVSLSSAEQYTALQRGTVDCTYTGTDSYVGFKLYEVAPYVTKFQHPYGGNFIIMNNKAWNKIPGHHQKKILDVGREFMDIMPQITIDEQDALYKEMVANGAKLYNPNPELKKSMEDVLKPLWERYIKVAGDTGKEIYRIIYSRP